MDKKSEDPPEKVILGVAFLWVLFHNRKYRRNLLFGSTVLTMFLVFVGAVFLTKPLSEHPVAFLLYWLICFILVGFVLILALYDLLQIRKEHRLRMSVLDRELEKAAEEARRLAEEAKAEEGESPPANGN